MSSYLTIYLVPCKIREIRNEKGELEEKEIDTTPFVLDSYPRSDEVYEAFYEAINIAYAGDEDKYTELTEFRMDSVIEAKEEELRKANSRLDLLFKALEKHYDSELLDDINSMEEYIMELNSCFRTLQKIAFVVNCVYCGYSDFEKVLINID